MGVRVAAAVRAALVGLVLAAVPAAAQETAGDGITRSWAIAEFGEPLYGPDMPHWPYANPDAPKGGSITLGAFGSFDTLTTLIERGTWPAGIGLTTDGLTTGSGDELSSAYGLIAETMEYPADKSWIRFHLREEARWHDGTPITAEDFVYSLDFVRKEGRLFLRSFFDDIERCEATDTRVLTCHVRTRDTMKPLMAAAGLWPMPRHYWQAEGRDPTRTTLVPPLGSGAYRIKSVEAGRSITYERVKDYWAKDLPMMQGLFNFDEIRYDYYRDDNVQFEALMAGRIDFRAENRAQRWATGYETNAVRQGRLVRREVPDNAPHGMLSYVFNTRRPQFQDIRVRQAINHLYDFETIQRQLLYGQYKRIKSWFPNSDYGAKGPPTPEELAALAPYRDRVRPEVLTDAFEPPSTDGSGRSRENLRKAYALFNEAGWEHRDGRLVNAQTGRQFAFEILLYDPSSVRLAEPFVTHLKRAGIDASIRVVDTAQYKVRTDEYDFDMVSLGLTFFPPPGPELRSYYSSAVADVPGQGNFAAIRDPVVDELLETIVTGTDLPTIEATTRAMDRVLLSGWYVIPLWYNDTDRLAYWDRFGYPETMARYSHGFPTTWWIDAARDAALRKAP
ncbi:extracellular solute-binding protein [Azospirillum halopraeferens]|uniref:extracellular solute-binding protein n=1 Tax=Azospirillum halopraeferens TaxID=34010 RepID=UPI0004290C5D|nr:extracellular solute-binding protein [Azospirillum halopraeferens]